MVNEEIRTPQGDAIYAYVYALKWGRKSTKKISGYIPEHGFIGDNFLPYNSDIFQAYVLLYLSRILQ